MKYSFLLILFSIITSSLNAQETFTDKLRKDIPGSGKVIVEQSAEIERVVNNISSVKSVVPVLPVGEQTEEARKNESGNVSSRLQNGAHNYVARGRHKAAGYRICIYMGGNSRKDKASAMQMGDKCREEFGELSVYTRFIAPRWVTHVGDFRTKVEAQRYVDLIRKANFTYIVRIVRSEVNLPNE